MMEMRGHNKSPERRIKKRKQPKKPSSTIISELNKIRQPAEKQPRKPPSPT